jgi:hypothetical protein
MAARARNFENGLPVFVGKMAKDYGFTHYASREFTFSVSLPSFP